ncbi:cardiolipin synthase [Heyndrickxia acidicola]|uniref:Cardiolipin synthase n=1 Tax=Heyndrickxia acidicola TaxID=209389 RepID=A0ABU6ME05_9BACI|nr:cardiolipin synthase [Heyndrickxia acidicola]MED1202887.1 cardiolipin synthase [Heyndrickxia acidicola]
MTWLWLVLFILCIIAILILTDFYVGKHFYQKHTKKRDYPLRKGEITIITNGEELFSRLFSEIEAARTSIHILFYIVKKDQISNNFLNLLERKAKEGVQVRLLLDWVGSHGVSKKGLNKLKHAGAAVSFCHKPRFPFLFFSSQQRNHRKITVLDGQIGYMGGYNVGREYINLDPNLSPWRDYHLRITGESVKDLQKEFIFNWKRSTRQSLPENKMYFPELESGTVLHQFYPTEGVRMESSTEQLIKNAETSIIIGTPYFIPPPAIVNSLLNALEKGIKVKIIVPEKTDHALVKEASYRYFRKLIPAGAEVYQYQNGFYHAKVAIIDKKVCDIGSANFDRRSFFLNHELNCYIHNPDFIGKLLSVIHEDLANSKLLSNNKLKSPPLPVKLKEWSARMIEDLL